MMVLKILLLLQLVAEIGSVVPGINNVGYLLFRLINSETTNTIISPFSLGTGLHFLLLGAAGKSHTLLFNYLNPNITDPHNQLQNIVERLVKSEESITVSISNMMFHHYQSTLSPGYQSNSQTFYNASVYPVDVENIEKVTEQINRQVSDETNGKIFNLLSKGDINEETKLVLANVLYFKGEWRNKFKKSFTQNKKFYLDSHRQQHVLVPTMQQTSHFKYIETNEFEGVALELKRTEVEMVIYKPKSNLKQLVESLLKNDKVNEFYHEMEYSLVELHLPKFTTRNEHNLKSALQSTGLEQLFDDEHADFSKITASGARELTLSEVLHHTFLSISEEGCEAAAATASVMRLTRSADISTPVVLRVDVPFLYMLRDRLSGAVLFLGEQSHFEGVTIDRTEL